ncbi:enoyl-CoA hydratase/isomerase family protein [Gordonia sp. ABSL1-1]|uniref:enoyl-CoA hydratase/isomerase family protein n=1 Tax=Gordonia sp. ABSL1-1 TaxID=3053923 RepID=UPI0025729AC6|nr:enoyl-CoA hydratase/isomerase family protein [Gordonia sp. ABSL1-1]MDL9935964.1 enoyl-CoA hydratase/isomerase family protein [Gordonia sp. ABSL1-1]
MTASIEYRETIAVLTLGADENRFSPDWLAQVNQLLDEIESNAQALITIGDGKFYSNGLDLDWLLANGDRADWYVDQVHALFARILTFGIPTVAAINGHAFGAGAMVAIAHDFRVMRADRGFYCFPEADINIPFTPGMAALIQNKLTPQHAVEAMTTGRRYGGPDAVAAGIAERAVDEASLVDAAIERVTPILGKDKGTVGAIKSVMFTSVTDALRAGRR